MIIIYQVFKNWKWFDYKKFLIEYRNWTKSCNKYTNITSVKRIGVKNLSKSRPTWYCVILSRLFTHNEIYDHVLFFSSWQIANYAVRVFFLVHWWTANYVVWRVLCRLSIKCESRITTKFFPLKSKLLNIVGALELCIVHDIWGYPWLQ